MSKIDYDILNAAQSSINPLGERELDLRGLKIQKIDNLTLTHDQNDCLNLTNNDITHLDNLSFLPNLKTIILSNNRLVKFSKNLVKYIPNLKVLIANNNNLTNIGDLDPLKDLELTDLCLLDNPVYLLNYYRLYLIHSIPSLKTLDFKRIKEKVCFFN
jgi:U2 small nuclear ribonucleoprotein A'